MQNVPRTRGPTRSQTFASFQTCRFVSRCTDLCLEFVSTLHSAASVLFSSAPSIISGRLIFPLFVLFYFSVFLSRQDLSTLNRFSWQTHNGCTWWVPNVWFYFALRFCDVIIVRKATNACMLYLSSKMLAHTVSPDSFKFMFRSPGLKDCRIQYMEQVEVD